MPTSHVIAGFKWLKVYEVLGELADIWKSHSKLQLLLFTSSLGVLMDPQNIISIWVEYMYFIAIDFCGDSKEHVQWVMKTGAVFWWFLSLLAEAEIFSDFTEDLIMTQLLVEETEKLYSQIASFFWEWTSNYRIRILSDVRGSCLLVQRPWLHLQTLRENPLLLLSHIWLNDFHRAYFNDFRAGQLHWCLLLVICIPRSLNP